MRPRCLNTSFDIFAWHKRLPDINQNLQYLLKYFYFESIACNFGHFNETYVEFCHTIYTNFFLHGSLLQHNDKNF